MERAENAGDVIYDGGKEYDKDDLEMAVHTQDVIEIALRELQHLRHGAPAQGEEECGHVLRPLIRFAIHYGDSFIQLCIDQSLPYLRRNNR